MSSDSRLRREETHTVTLFTTLRWALGSPWTTRLPQEPSGHRRDTAVEQGSVVVLTWKGFKGVVCGRI